MQKTDRVQREEVLETREIGIAGMTCDNCVRRVEQALGGVPGVKELTVDRAAGRARVVFDSTQTGLPALHDAVSKSGYQPVPLAS